VFVCYLRGPHKKLGWPALLECGKEAQVTKVIERVDAHYEIQNVEMGKVYRWCPERSVLECSYGEELTLSAFNITCPECGSDHAGIVEEVLEARPEDEIEHPWRSLHPYYTPLLHAPQGHLRGKSRGWPLLHVRKLGER
jgi:hypothetical protein